MANVRSNTGHKLCPLVSTITLNPNACPAGIVIRMKYMPFVFLCFKDNCGLQVTHSKKKSAFKHLFWCFRLSQIENSILYLEGPNGIWKDHLVIPGTE